MDKGRVLSLKTQHAYAVAWQTFLNWCVAMSEPTSLPVPPERVVAYIEALPAGVGPGGLRLRLAALANAHRLHGVASPTGHVAVRAAQRQSQTSGPVAHLADQLVGCGDDLAGLRNRAMVLMNEVSGLTLAQIVGLDREDLRFGDRALVLRVRPPQAAADDLGQTVRLLSHRGGPLCPVYAMERWLQTSGISRDAVFRAISRSGMLERRLGVVGIRRLLRQIKIQAIAQAAPEQRKPVRGAWRKQLKAKSRLGSRVQRSTQKRGSGKSKANPPPRPGIL